MTSQAAQFNELVKRTEYFAKNDRDTARVLAVRAMRMARALGDSGYVAKSMNAHALIETYGGDFSNAIDFCKNGISIIDSADWPETLAQLYNTLAKNLKSQQKYEGAMDFYLRSLSIRKKINDTAAIIGTLINIGGLNSSMKKYEIGLNYYLEAEKLAIHTTHREAKGSLYNNIAIVYRKLGDSQGALEYYNKALQIYNSINWEYGQAYVLGNIGVLFENSETSGDSALHYYNRALKIHEKLNDHYGIGITKINIALVLTQKKMFSKAEKLFHESISIAKKIESSRLMEYAYEGLADLEEKRGNFRKAFQYYKKNREIVDSVYNAKKHKQIAELETKYQTERKNKEISLLQKNAKIRELTLKEQSQKIRINQLLIVLLIAIIVLGAILIIVLLKLNKTQHMNTKNKLEILIIKYRRARLVIAHSGFIPVG
ncbi:MAG: tetratricopeptide repeat protein [Salinivirgaceae bacterium]